MHTKHWSGHPKLKNQNTQILKDENKQSYAIDLGSQKNSSGYYSKKKGSPGVFVVNEKFYNTLKKDYVEFLNRKLIEFKEKDVVRHSLVRRLLKRYKPSFNVIDDISAEKTISMWIQDELDSPADGSIESIKNSYEYNLKRRYFRAS